MTSCQQLSFLQWVHCEGITQTDMYWAVLCCVWVCSMALHRITEICLKAFRVKATERGILP